MLFLYQSKQPIVQPYCHRSLKYFHFGEENFFWLGKIPVCDIQDPRSWSEWTWQEQMSLL